MRKLSLHLSKVPAELVLKRYVAEILARMRSSEYLCPSLLATCSHLPKRPATFQERSSSSPDPIPTVSPTRFTGSVSFSSTNESHRERRQNEQDRRLQILYTRSKVKTVVNDGLIHNIPAPSEVRKTGGIVLLRLQLIRRRFILRADSPT